MDPDKSRPDLIFLLKAAIVWFSAALILLILSSAMISGLNLSSSYVAYFSAGISFLSALAAAVSASAGKQAKRLKYALCTGLVLTVLLLMLGFIAVGSELSPDGVLSVVSFTMVGALAGGLFAPKNQSVKMKKRIKVKRGKS